MMSHGPHKTGLRIGAAHLPKLGGRAPIALRLVVLLHLGVGARLEDCGKRLLPNILLQG